MLVSLNWAVCKKNEQVQYRTSANEENVTNKCYHTKHTRTSVPRLVPYRTFCRACCLRPSGVLTRPGTRAHVGRSERQLARSRAHETEQPDVEVRISVRPCLPELGLGLPSFHSRPPSLFVEYPGPNAPCAGSPAVPSPSPQPHANSGAAIRDVTCLFAAGRYKPAKNKDAHRREHDFHLVLKYRR